MNKEVLILSSFFDKDLISDVVNGVKSRNTISYDDLINEVNKKNYFSRINLNFFLSKNYSTIEIFLGNEYIFKKILNEYSINFSNFDQSLEKLIKKINPKIIIMRDIAIYPIESILKIKQSQNLNFKIILLNGFPIRNKNQYNLFDCVVFRNPWLIRTFKNLCKKTELIYHCFNTNIHDRVKIIEFNKRQRIISFDGSSYSHGFYEHKKRYFYLFKLLEKNLIDANIFEKNSLYYYLIYYLFILTKKYKKFELVIIIFLKNISKLNKFLFNRYYKKIDNLIQNIENFNSDNYNLFYRGPLTKNFKNKINKPNFGDEYYTSISQSKISLNIHTESMGNTACNIRLFEITGMKSCMLTENFENLKDLFDINNEVITYSSINELIEKINFLKENLNYAENIANNGFKRLIKDHSDVVRSQQYLHLIKSII
jgi:hypothetical protein